MALIIKNRTTCLLCDAILAEDEEIVAFPAFLPAHHDLGVFSDAAMHRRCFEADPRSATVSGLYARYRSIWESRPELKTLAEMEAWGRQAFKKFP